MQTLTTAYEYNANDQLITESNTISALMGYIPVRIENKYAATANVTRGSPSAGITWMRAPSALSYWAFNSTPYLLLFAFLAPLVAAVARRWTSPRPLRASAKTLTAYRLPLAFRGVASVLAVAMFILGSPFETLAQEAELYSQIQATDWGQDGSVTNYIYDDNGSMTQKVKTEPGKTTTEILEYNLENRLSAHTKTVDDGIDVIVTETAYTYNQDGIRVKSQSTTTINEQLTDESTNIYLIDSFNHTGYAQVLEEFDGVSATPVMSYTVGDDVLSQTSGSLPLPLISYLLYDGHGSTRQLADSAGSITAQYSFDAYGHMLGQQAGAQAQQATSLLYAGEQFDTGLQQYYLRARYYDQNNGRFNRLDPVTGSNYDPQSLHKYAYAHNEPVNGVDPSGKFTLIESVVVIAVTVILLVALGWAILKNYSKMDGIAIWRDPSATNAPILWGTISARLNVLGIPTSVHLTGPVSKTSSTVDIIVKYADPGNSITPAWILFGRDPVSGGGIGVVSDKPTSAVSRSEDGTIFLNEAVLNRYVATDYPALLGSPLTPLQEATFWTNVLLHELGHAAFAGHDLSNPSTLMYKWISDKTLPSTPARIPLLNSVLDFNTSELGEMLHNFK